MLRLNLSAEFKAFIQWCENPENMPAIEDLNAEFDPELTCPISMELPRIPVELLGRIYCLESISDPDPQNSSKRILKIQQETVTRQPITNPDVDIKPVALNIRNMISRERKKLAGTQAPKPAPASVSTPAQAKAQPAPQTSSAKPASFFAPVEKPAPVATFKTLPTQEEFNTAMRTGNMKLAEAILLEHLKLPPPSKVSIVGGLLEAGGAHQFTDDKSCMRMLFSFSDIKICNGWLGIFQQAGSILSSYNFGLECENFSERLLYIYELREQNPTVGFEPIYDSMLAKFEPSALPAFRQ